ncbi:ATP-binding protein [Bifidobacterium sp. ESL0800]|uniref:ATP-binding protein n=1 Tax=Bifidobacterium sp. ESL0800 TaxID=2983236 RepID=UPI0023F887EC|nr:ATP-binding protein [Bifidobacterium sp. ESL0800]WEV75515.1 ATP-binding protein [Bifidobacterium sp. ESL0800]
MIERTLSTYVKKLATWFPVVSITGPRQSGKSTLIQSVFGDYEYINLERPNVRANALNDPVSFIENRPDRLIIDEAQYAPDLFSMIQTESDRRGTTGQYILSGSQNFLMLKNVKQSLAGRAGIARLLPLSYMEAQGSAQKPSADEFMLRGGYPRPYDVGIDLDAYFDAYISSYIERDVKDYLDVRNIDDFRRFLRLCALNTGNLTNYTNLANDLGVSFRTVKSWLSILESSYILFTLPPYFKSAGKRVVKTPKLYFYDTGLLCNLLGIHSMEQLLNHEMFGAVFENLIVAETAKHYYNEGKKPELYFYRDADKQEVDLIDKYESAAPKLLEIKSSKTYHDRQGRTLAKLGGLLGVPRERCAIVYRGTGPMQLDQYAVINATDYLRFDYPDATLPGTRPTTK